MVQNINRIIPKISFPHIVSGKQWTHQLWQPNTKHYILIELATQSESNALKQVMFCSRILLKWFQTMLCLTLLSTQKLLNLTSCVLRGKVKKCRECLVIMTVLYFAKLFIVLLWPLSMQQGCPTLLPPAGIQRVYYRRVGQVLDYWGIHHYLTGKM